MNVKKAIKQFVDSAVAFALWVGSDCEHLQYLWATLKLNPSAPLRGVNSFSQWIPKVNFLSRPSVFSLPFYTYGFPLFHFRPYDSPSFFLYGLLFFSLSMVIIYIFVYSALDRFNWFSFWPIYHFPPVIRSFLLLLNHGVVCFSSYTI
jgi:hypothetical protein